MTAHARKGIVNADNGVYKDTDRDDDQQKACPAAGMKARLLPDVFNGKFFPMLVAEDGLMLRPVVGENALHIAHTRAKTHIQEQNTHPHNTLGKVSHDVIAGERLYEANDRRGQEDEQEKRQRDTQYHRDADDELLRLFLREMLLYPEVELVLLALLLDRDEVGRVCKRLHPVYHRA